MIVVGIDPGVTGAIAIHDGGRLTHVDDMPVFGGRTDALGLMEYLIEAIPYNAEAVVYLEDTQAMPKNGSIASYSLGLNTGIVVGVIQSLRHPLVRVKPAAWKVKMGVTRRDKNAMRGVVRELYPGWADHVKRVKDHNRAEAILISRYGVAQQLQEANA